MSAQSTPATHQLLDWLKEREANARAIARHKAGADRDGWLEDAAYFKAAAASVWERAATNPAKQSPAEPVAYRYKDTRGNWRYVGAPLTEGWGFPENLRHEPLYAAPPQSADDQAQDD
jgi:hypothetical protein